MFTAFSRFIWNKIKPRLESLVYRTVNPLLQTNLQKEFEELKYIHLPASKVHGDVFPKYRNIYQGKDIVLVASGPTVKDYSMFNDAIHIGVNHTYTLDYVCLDYLFMHDNLVWKDAPLLQKNANLYRGADCKKFYGYHFMNRNSIPEKDAIEANAERYYFVNKPTSDFIFTSTDISTRPLNCWNSIVFPAVEFALYTHPKRIYLVGCDCSANGHIFHTEKENFFPTPDDVKHGWEMIKEFKDYKYPDIEIISVNPVGLKGLFKDIYTQSYVDKNQELLKEDISILKEKE